jgi:capsular polysaccharide biosynthesis protein
MENNSLLNKLENINEQLNLAHYWIIFLKYKRIIFFTPILFGLLGFFISLNINPTFQSRATLVIEESTKNMQKHYFPNTVAIQLNYFNEHILNNKTKLQLGVVEKKVEVGSRGYV